MKEISTGRMVDEIFRQHISPMRRTIEAVANQNGKGPCYEKALDHLDALIVQLREMREGKP